MDGCLGVKRAGLCLAVVADYEAMAPTRWFLAIPVLVAGLIGCAANHMRSNGPIDESAACMRKLRQNDRKVELRSTSEIGHEIEQNLGGKR